MAKYRFDLIVSAVCFVLLGYFSWHAIEGPRSFAHRDRLIAKAEGLEERLIKLKEAQGAMEARVQLMRPESVDPDMLDELARRTLQYVAPADFIVTENR
jgi:cell division protein FtsB